MLFKILEKNEFRSLVDILLDSTEVIGPKRIDTGSAGRDVMIDTPAGISDEQWKELNIKPLKP